MPHTGPPSGPPSSPPLGPPPGPPPSGPPPGQPPHQPAAGGSVETARLVLGGLLVAGATALAILVLVLLLSTPDVEASGRPLDADGFSTGSPVTTDVRCRSAAGGSPAYDSDDYDDGVVVEPLWSRGDRDLGLEAGQVNALCDLARTSRLAHSIEAGFGALVLFHAGFAIGRRRRAR